MHRQIRLLARHFFWRFLDNDLISPDSDVHETGALLMAFLAVPTLLGTGLLLIKYASPWVTPYERLVLALPDKFGYIAWSMLVMALVTLVDWDALALDTRDYAILGPLPLASSTVLAGKLVALLFFASAVVVAVNLVPTVFFPLVYMSSTAAKLPLSAGIWTAVGMAVGHAVSCVAASMFAFLVIVALRSALVLTVGPSLFRRVSVPIQFVAAIALVIGFFNSYSWARVGARLYLSPPAWFLGLYETIAGRISAGLPPATGLLKWQVAREHQARETYAALQPLFPGLASLALLAVAAAGVAALAFYFAAHLRHASRLRQPATTEPAVRLQVRRRLESMARRFLVRDPLAQASFFFTWQTLARSSRHKLFAGAYIAAGVLIIYSTIAPLVVRSPHSIFLQPSASLLSLQFVLSFFVLVGLRVVFTIPAELRANWVFRLTAASGVERYLSGVRRLLAIAVTAPLFIALVPVHALVWGWRAALLHCGFGVLWALVLVEVLLLGLEKLPFTCSHVPGKGNVKVFWPVYLAAFAVYAYAFARFEASALRSAGGSLRLAIFLLALLGGLAVYRTRLLSRRTGFVFDDLSDATPVTLGL